MISLNLKYNNISSKNSILSYHIFIRIHKEECILITVHFERDFMKKRIVSLSLVLCLSCLSTSVGASLIQYNLSGNIPLTREIYNPDGSTGYEEIILTVSGACFISDEDTLPDDLYRDYFNIMSYKVNIGEYNFLDSSMPGLVEFRPLDLYISLAGGRFTECYGPPHGLPSSFSVSSMRSPTDWYNQMYAYSGYTFRTMSLTFERASAPIPEPSTLLLIGSCFPALALLRRRFMK
jgi:hypothetical protein